MNATNGKRLVAGGLVAAIVLTIGRGVTETALAEQYRVMFERLGVTGVGESAMLLVLAFSALVGMTAVWLYTAVRRTYGAGPRTALKVACAVWVLSCVAPSAMLLAFGIITPTLFTIGMAADLVQVTAAVLAGAWVYRDATDPATARVPAAAGI